MLELFYAFGMSAKEIATAVVKKLQEAGHTAYFAGGWVRDFLLGHPSDDIDIATSAAPEEVQTLFSKTVPVGIAFGIVLVIENGQSFEVATFREDLSYKDGRRPVGYINSKPEEDAKRRDFTINGMFYDPIEEKLYDFVEGKKDLQQGIVRAIGDPHERFGEDRLRMIRAIRYATRFGFPIEEETHRAILAHAKELLPAVAMERVWQEFQKMANFASLGQSIKMLYELDLLQQIFPELSNMGLNEISRRVNWLERAPKQTPPILQILFLFPNETRDFWLSIGEKLKVSRDDKEMIDFSHRLTSLFSFPTGWQKELEKSEWVAIYAHRFINPVLSALAAHLPEREQNRFEKEHRERMIELSVPIERRRNNKTLVTSQDLLQEGVSPSVLMGQLLERGEEIAINENLSDKKAILNQLKNDPLWKKIPE